MGEAARLSQEVLKPRVISRNREGAAVFAVFLLYALLQINAIRHGNYAGQDFQRNKLVIVEAAADPIKTLTMVSAGNRGLPTLYHLGGAAVYRLAGREHYLPVLAVGDLILNLGALGFFYAIVRRVIQADWLKLTWLIWIAFLPLFVIPSVVIASDAATGILYSLAIWLNIQIFERGRSLKSSVWLMAGLSVVLILMVMVKMNFALCIAGELLIIAGLGRARVISRQVVLIGLALLVAIPAVATGVLYKIYLREQISAYAVGDRHSPPLLTRMSLRSFLFFRPEDRDLLEAPFFHEFRYTRDGLTRPMHMNNYYSYPGMLPLALFTDVLNIYQPIVFESNSAGTVDEYYTRIRPPENKVRMQAALGIGLIFYFAGIFLVPWVVIGILRRILTMKLPDSDLALAILSLSCCILPVLAASVLGFDSPYYKAGWLPRLFWPVCVGGLILLFAGLERCLIKKVPVMKWVVLALVLSQTALNISFLWVKGQSGIFPSIDIIDQPVRY